jgi:hypothetical protein
MGQSTTSELLGGAGAGQGGDLGTDEKRRVGGRVGGSGRCREGIKSLALLCLDVR